MQGHGEGYFDVFSPGVVWVLEQNDLALNPGFEIFYLNDDGHCFNLFQPQFYIYRMWIKPASSGHCET